MKQIYTLLFFLTFFSLQAQLTNVNPDPNGEPWLVGGLRVPSEEELARIPVMELSQDYLQRSISSLPVSLDNTTQPYFRPVFNQADGSCSQASGVAYNFTYEINRERDLPANSHDNQYPSHYTYNFLNGGSGSNGSWYVDGWEIIKANGCPTITTYGGSINTGGAIRWMSGYDNYEISMNNRVKDYFAIDVGTPEGLLNLKHWMYDHMENASTGGLVNFAAGAANFGYSDTTDASGNYIITSWGPQVNHAMTFVGWDDNIAYDYNNDGQITNDVDTNGDGVVDMKDWERGALLMVNSWGTGWGNNGKAYVMYRTLAIGVANGGILGKKVFAVRAKTSQNAQLKMRVKIFHNRRKLIKIMAGISADINDTSPAHTIEFPMFNRQGGDNYIQGVNNNPIEISLDISPLLNHIEPNVPAKFFLIVNEDDPSGNGLGTIYDFSIIDNSGQISTCSQHNVSLNNNDDTLLSITTSVDFDKPVIVTNSLPVAPLNSDTYSVALSASGGTPDYLWKVIQHYQEETLADSFPAITSNALSFSNNDDSFTEQTLDFDFPFYGEIYDKVYVSTDGSLRFEPSFEYIRSEAAIKAFKVISAFASDLKLFSADGDNIYYEGDATHATFRWKASLFGNQAANVDAAVTLYPNGEIDFFYGDNITTGLDWAAGISDGEGSSTILSISGATDPNNQAYKIEYQPYPIGMYVTPDGIWKGTTPSVENTWQVDFQVTDNNNISSIKTLDFTTQVGGIVEEENIYQLSVFPNPVLNKATFSYELPKKNDVSLIIYDLSGKPVETLVNKKQNPGLHKIIWYPQISKGVYIYRLTTSKGTSSGKLIVK